MSKSKILIAINIVVFIFLGFLYLAFKDSAVIDIIVPDNYRGKVELNAVGLNKKGKNLKRFPFKNRLYIKESAKLEIRGYFLTDFWINFHFFYENGAMIDVLDVTDGLKIKDSMIHVFTYINNGDVKSGEVYKFYVGDRKGAEMNGVFNYY